MIDPRGLGRIGFEAFSEFVVEAVLASFAQLDKDKSGSLDTQELLAAAKARHRRLSPNPPPNPNPNCNPNPVWRHSESQPTVL